MAESSTVGPRLDGLAASEPIPAGDKTALQNTVASKLAIGHQEVDRIVDEVEQIYGSQPTEWLTLKPIGMMLLHEFYEDFDELEDALGGSFQEFIEAMPQATLIANATVINRQAGARKYLPGGLYNRSLGPLLCVHLL